MKHTHDYDRVRNDMADVLEQHIVVSASLSNEAYDQFDLLIPRDGGPKWSKLLVALHFWDSWIDASNHEWRYHEPIAETDWIVLASVLVADLRLNREISHPLLLQHFG